MAKISLPVVLTPTRVENAARCQRRHAITDILEKGKDKNVAAAFGNVIHAGHGEFWRAQEFYQASQSTALESAIKAIEADWSKQELEDRNDKYTLDKAKSMFNAYASQARRAGPWSSAGDWKVFSIEDRIRFKVGDYILSFQIDRSFVDKDAGKALVGDLKTVTRPDNRWKTSWYKSVQMKLYSYGFRQNFEFDDVEFFIEGLDKNVKSKVHEVMLPQWSDALLNEAVELFKRKAEADEKLIMSAMVNGVVDMALLEDNALINTDYNYQDCFSYNYECAYLPLCMAEPEERRALLNAEYKDIPAEY